MKKNIKAAGLVGLALSAIFAAASITIASPGQGPLTHDLLGVVGLAATIIVGIVLYPLYLRLSDGSLGGVVEAILAQVLVVLVLWPSIYSLLLRLAG
ncbi:MAG: hypothetical protein F7B20_03505 [Aeropyrum sp.]|nr:hypothetical protein [Aeropyrum sp.]MCE4615631.1 hypothetical protein [Aeropyrum sp.]